MLSVENYCTVDCVIFLQSAITVGSYFINNIFYCELKQIVKMYLIENFEEFLTTSHVIIVVVVVLGFVQYLLRFLYCVNLDIFNSLASLVSLVLSEVALLVVVSSWSRARFT